MFGPDALIIAESSEGTDYVGKGLQETKWTIHCIHVKTFDQDQRNLMPNYCILILLIFRMYLKRSVLNVA